MSIWDIALGVVLGAGIIGAIMLIIAILLAPFMLLDSPYGYFGRWGQIIGGLFSILFRKGRY